MAVVMAVGGYAVGYSTGVSRTKESAKAEGYAEALTDAKAKIGTSAYFPTVRLTSLRGTVKAVNGGVLDIEVGQTVANPLETQAPLVRHVTLAKDATVVKSVQKSDAVTFAELADYEKAARAAQEKGTPPPAPPVPYTLEKIALGDIKAGDTVVVDSQSDIALAETIVATGVRKEVQPAVVTAPPASTAPSAPLTPPTTPTTPPPPARTPPTTPTTPPPPAPKP